MIVFLNTVTAAVEKKKKMEIVETFKLVLS